jgi:lycopene beta-cyclase
MAHYDYILAGAGLAGLSLVYYLLESDLKDKKILLIDPQGRSIPDKTWCYWSEKPFDIHPRESIHAWSQLSFVTDDTKITKSLGKLRYFHLNSHDFYSSIFAKLTAYPNVNFLKDKVLNISEYNDQVQVTTQHNGTLNASFVFDSRLDPKEFEKSSALKQVFSGWKIQTQTESFDPTSLILMEFPKKFGHHFEFFYILPFSKTEALIEYTAYSQNPISENDLNVLLKNYLHNTLGDTSFEITFRETGVIPMSTFSKKSAQSNYVIPIGTAAGWTKASTGYTFHTIQKNCQQIVQKLSTGTINSRLNDRSTRFTFYDNILLNIAHKWPNQLQGLFLNLFETSPASQVLRFLSEETTLIEELGILGKLRFPIFIKSLMRYESH